MEGMEWKSSIGFLHLFTFPFRFVVGEGEEMISPGPQFSRNRNIITQRGELR